MTGYGHGRFVGLVAIAALATAAGLSAGHSGAEEPPPPAVVLPDAPSFALLDAARRLGANALVSPASLLSVVAMTRAGIEGGGEPPAIPGYVSVTNAVWLNEGQKLTEPAAARLAGEWAAHTETLALGTDGQARINAWVDEATHGRIPSLIDEPLSAAEAVVTNTLYFKGAWMQPFEPADTAPAAFTRGDGTSVEVPFMTGTASFPSWSVDGDTIVALGFTEGGLLLLRLPAEAGSAPADRAGARLPLAEAAGVRVALPRMELAGDSDLSVLVRAIGLDADLAEGFATLTAEGLVPGPVLQSVTLSVDEAGAEAAAATAAIGVRSAAGEPPPLVRFDRPFDIFLVAPGAPTALIAAAVDDPRS